MAEKMTEVIWVRSRDSCWPIKSEYSCILLHFVGDAETGSLAAIAPSGRWGVRKISQASASVVVYNVSHWIVLTSVLVFHQNRWGSGRVCVSYSYGFRINGASAWPRKSELGLARFWCSDEAYENAFLPLKDDFYFYLCVIGIITLLITNSLHLSWEMKPKQYDASAY